MLPLMPHTDAITLIDTPLRRHAITPRELLCCHDYAAFAIIDVSLLMPLPPLR